MVTGGAKAAPEMEGVAKHQRSSKYGGAGRRRHCSELDCELEASLVLHISQSFTKVAITSEEFSM